MLPKADLDRITKILDSMKQYELILSDFYRQCAEVFTEDRSLWQALAEDEIRHAANIEQMRDIILKKPERFESGRPFNPTAINTAISGLKDYTEKIKKESLTS